MAVENTEICFIEPDRLLAQAMELCQGGYRLIQAHCIGLVEGKLELAYSFELAYQIKEIRLKVEPGLELPSISAIFPAAFLSENEMHDLFGIDFKNMSIDYKGNLYRTTVSAPYQPVAADKGEA